MEKFYNAVCWIGIGIVAVFAVPVILFRAGAIAWLAIWMIFFSSLPWWERTLAAAAVIACFAYFISKSNRRRISPNRKFVN